MGLVIRCYETNFSNNYNPCGNYILQMMVSTQHLFFGLHIADWLGALQQKELRENDDGELNK